MPKLGPIWIDDRILDAIRDDRLVVFAGAGVSMGPPANLPDFVKLAKDIAAGTGLVLTDYFACGGSPRRGEISAKQPLAGDLGVSGHRSARIYAL
jgi:hypothetical protein